MGKGLPRSLKNKEIDLKAGSPNGTGVAAEYAALGSVKKVVLRLTDHAVTMVDEAGVVAYGSSKIFDFDEGHIIFVAAIADLDLTLSAAGINATWDGDMGLGSAAAGNDGTLSSTEQDFIPTTATPQAVASVTTANGVSTATESGVFHDGSTTAKDMYLNLLVDDADHDVTSTPTNIIVNGTVEIYYYDLGDI